MDFIYTFFISFMLIFVSELGDKTQLIVLSFSNKLKASRILLGVAIGTLLSHGVAILFGSHLGMINESFRFYLSVITYISFILFGVWGFFHNSSNDLSIKKSTETSKKSHSTWYYILFIATSIIIGELGDKTFLASLGLGIEYPFYKFSLVLGSVCGMVASNSIAVLFGKFLDTKLNSKYIQFLSNILFIIFGMLGFLKILF